MHQRSNGPTLLSADGLGFHEISRRMLAHGFEQRVRSELRNHSRRAVLR